MKTEIKLGVGFVKAALSLAFLLVAVIVGGSLIHAPARAQLSVPGQPLVPLGYCQLTSIDTAAALTACSGGIPAGANAAVLQAETQAIRYRDDAVNPTTTVGMPAAVGATFFYAGTLTKVRVISAVSGAKLNVLFYRQ